VSERLTSNGGNTDKVGDVDPHGCPPIDDNDNDYDYDHNTRSSEVLCAASGSGGEGMRTNKGICRLGP
jgi:hypothetical protein